MHSIYNNLDPLRVCVVGRGHDPSVFSAIENPRMRNVLEILMLQTNEDLDGIVNYLGQLGVEIMRPSESQFAIEGKFLPPMLTPRDHLAVIRETFYMPTPILDNKWKVIRGSSWPASVPDTFDSLPDHVIQELSNFGISKKADLYDYDFRCFATIGNEIGKSNAIIYDRKIDSAMHRIYGNRLFIGTWPGEREQDIRCRAEELFPDLEHIVVPSEGHLDGVMFIACEGLLFSSRDIEPEFYKVHFPDWQIVYDENLENSSGQDRAWQEYKSKNQGRWFLENMQFDEQLYGFIENYFSHWTGNAAESTYDINMLSLDKNNVCCIVENEKNFKIMESYDISVHVLPFRHHKFWDAGLHCLTADIHRKS